MNLRVPLNKRYAHTHTDTIVIAARRYWFTCMVTIYVTHTHTLISLCTHTQTRSLVRLKWKEKTEPRIYPKVFYPLDCGRVVQHFANIGPQSYARSYAAEASTILSRLHIFDALESNLRCTTEHHRTKYTFPIQIWCVNILFAIFKSTRTLEMTRVFHLFSLLLDIHFMILNEHHFSAANRSKLTSVWRLIDKIPLFFPKSVRCVGVRSFHFFSQLSKWKRKTITQISMERL